MPMKIAKMAHHMVDIVIDEGLSFEAPARIEEAVLAACNCAEVKAAKVELCIRFASDAELQRLNQQWRSKDSVTDVLSFPMQEAPFNACEPLGDIALAVPFIKHEAERLNLPADDHCLHLIIHATLHLLGFDHINDDDAKCMQDLEKQAMQRMQLHHPYPDGEATTRTTVDTESL